MGKLLKFVISLFSKIPQWWVILLVALAISVGVGKYAYNLKQNLSRVKSNQEILMLQKDSSIRSLVLDKRELNTMLESEKAMKVALKDSMEVRIKDLESLVQMKSKIKIKYKTKLKDTTIHVRDTVIQYKSFYWEDAPWVAASGMIYKDEIIGSVQATDTIHVALYNKYKGWFFPRIFGKPIPCANVENSNPYVDMHVVKSIKLDK